MESLTKSLKKKHKKSKLRKLSDWLHLWLGIASGLIVFFLGVTGCIFSFQKEITEYVHKDQIFIQPPSNANTLPLSVLAANAERALGEKKKVTYITCYKTPDRAWEFMSYKVGDPDAFWYFDAIDNYDLVFVNPYTGTVTLTSNLKNEFFMVVKMLHWSFLINHPIGQQITGWATFIFVFLLISGMVMWWPKNLRKSNIDKSFKIKWRAKFKRINYDLHNVLGFYAMTICLMLGLTGMVFAFQWFQTTVYVAASQSITPQVTIIGKSDSTRTISSNPLDVAFATSKKQFNYADRIGMTPALETSDGVIYASGYRGEETYWNFDALQFDKYSGKALNRRNQSEKNAGEVLVSMNYDIHVGAIGGLTGKILAFFSSFIAASLPITGFIVWWNKKKKVVQVS